MKCRKKCRKQRRKRSATTKQKVGSFSHAIPILRTPHRNAVRPFSRRSAPCIRKFGLRNPSRRSRRSKEVTISRPYRSPRTFVGHLAGWRRKARPLRRSSRPGAALEGLTWRPASLPNDSLTGVLLRPTLARIQSSNNQCRKKEWGPLPKQRPPVQQIGGTDM
jgi:hypothetical protein